MKKTIKYLLLILFLFPIFISCSIDTSRYKENSKISFSLGYYEDEYTGEIFDGELDFYIGHRYNVLERTGIFDYKLQKYIYDNISIGVRIDDNEEYVERIEIPSEDFFKSEYYIKSSMVDKNNENFN